MKKFGIATLLVSAILAVLWLFGATEQKEITPLTEIDQAAIDSGSFSVYQSGMDKMYLDVKELCSAYKLTLERNTDTERLVGTRDDRSVYDVTCYKNALVGVWFSNLIAEGSFTFQLFGDPFSKDEYLLFRKAFIDIANKHKRDNEEISYSMKNGAVVR